MAWRLTQWAEFARAGAQTLDESVGLIPVAWAHELIADPGALSADDRAHIGNDLLRAVAQVILRYDVGNSNWQSWHNGTIGGAQNDGSIVHW